MPDEELLWRIRAALADEPVREKSMFGGRAFMVSGKMVVCAMKSGALLVRVPAEDHAQLVARRGARQAEMGPGRSMWRNWLEVSADALDDETLEEWMRVALDFNRRLVEGTG